MCTRPIQGFFRQSDGKKYFNPISQDSFRSGRTPSGYDFSGAVAPCIPCGKCLECRLKYSREWAIRCMHEAQMHASSSFVTLTYATEHLPFDGSVSKIEWQRFMKRLRYYYGKSGLRFLAVGEYGGKRSRPHYHALLFGLDFPDKVFFQYSRDGKTPLYRSPMLEKAWGKGICVIGDVTFESAAYVARYCLKKVDSAASARDYDRVHMQTGSCVQLEPEFLLSSRDGGIGRPFYDLYKDDIWRHDQVVIDGRTMTPPHRYFMWLKAEDPVLYEQVKKKRLESLARKSKKELMYARLRVREVLQESRQKRISRPLEDLLAENPLTFPAEPLGFWSHEVFPARLRGFKCASTPLLGVPRPHISRQMVFYCGYRKRNKLNLNSRN